MNVPITVKGHGMDVTPALHKAVTEKLSRLERRGDHITSISVTLSVENLHQVANGRLHVKKADLFAEAKAADMYTAIDDLVDKLNIQIVKHRQKETDHRARDVDHRRHSDDES